jgi:hypothetical protein
VLDKTVVRVVYSDESGIGGNLKKEPHTVVTAIVLDMDCQWIPVRNSVEVALKESHKLSDDQIARYVIKGKTTYHRIDFRLFSSHGSPV